MISCAGVDVYIEKPIYWGRNRGLVRSVSLCTSKHYLYSGTSLKGLPGNL